MTFLFYRLLTVALLPVVYIHVIWKAWQHREPRYLQQRLGFGYARYAREQPPLWIHCASVGEVNTLLPTLKHVHEQHPELRFLITTNTITGASIVVRQHLAYLQHCYLPFDWSFGIRRFLNVVNPSSLVVMETEIWPNLFEQCFSRDLPITIINARLSSRTLDANVFVRALLKHALSRVDVIAARSEQDAMSYRSLGADAGKVAVTGNMKLTTALNMQRGMRPDMQADDDFRFHRPYVLLASTHADEERDFVGRWQAMQRDELLVIAPRHPERAESIIRQIGSARLAQRSKGELPADDSNTFLLDTVGELKNYFANARVVIMGGSFAPIGGHNILEPASYGCPTITGPHMENFRDELALMLKRDAIVQVDDMEQLAAVLQELLDDADRREALKQNCSDISQDVTGILDRYAGLLLKQVS